MEGGPTDDSFDNLPVEDGEGHFGDELGSFFAKWLSVVYFLERFVHQA